MSLESFVPKDSFRCALVGPSRVGKTSLITALLDDAQNLLKGMPVRVVPADNATTTRINDNRNVMLGAIMAREFDAAALASTGEPQLFNIMLDAGGNTSESGLRFSILDYPGLWLSSPDRVPAAFEEDWKFSRNFMGESTVLLVPIDAAVLMEAVGPRERAMVPRLLDIAAVADVVTEWAKERNQRESVSEPAVLVLCPLKCESYFSDNGGTTNRSADLLERVKVVYGDIVQSARDEAADRAIQVLYAPIDTYGCVEIVRATWPTTEHIDRSFQAHYRLRPPYEAKPKGAVSVLQIFCRLMVDGQRKIEEDARDVATQQAEFARSELHRQRGFFSRIFFKLSGDQGRLEGARARSQSEADRLASRIAELNKAVEALASRDLDSRATWL